MNSEEDDAESEPAKRPRRVVRELPAEDEAGPADRLLYRIEGALDVSAFLAAVADVVERHDAWGLAVPDGNPAATTTGPPRARSSRSKIHCTAAWPTSISCCPNRGW